MSDGLSELAEFGMVTSEVEAKPPVYIYVPTNPAGHKAWGFLKGEESFGGDNWRAIVIPNNDLGKTPESFYHHDLYGHQHHSGVIAAIKAMETFPTMKAGNMALYVGAESDRRNLLQIPNGFKDSMFTIVEGKEPQIHIVVANDVQYNKLDGMTEEEYRLMIDDPQAFFQILKDRQRVEQFNKQPEHVDTNEAQLERLKVKLTPNLDGRLVLFADVSDAYLRLSTKRGEKNQGTILRELYSMEFAAFSDVELAIYMHGKEGAWSTLKTHWEKQGMSRGQFNKEADKAWNQAMEYYETYYRDQPELIERLEAEWAGGNPNYTDVNEAFKSQSLIIRAHAVGVAGRVVGEADFEEWRGRAENAVLGRLHHRQEILGRVIGGKSPFESDGVLTQEINDTAEHQLQYGGVRVDGSMTEWNQVVYLNGKRINYE
jgi:hypothetical protein